MLDKNLLFKASEAAIGITAAQAAIDEARRLVEEAKAGVETAKIGLSEAKAAYEAVISDIVASGVPSSKAKKAVEDMNRIFADVGIIDAADETSAEPKAPRKKKAEAVQAPETPASVKTPSDSVGSEVVVEDAQAVALAELAVLDAGLVDAAAADPAPETQENEIVVEPAVTEATVVAVEPELLVIESVDEVPETEIIDNGDAVGEIYEMIEEATVEASEEVSETLIAMLNAADWYSREWAEQPLDVAFFRSILTLDFVESALEQPMEVEMRTALKGLASAPMTLDIFTWFADVLDKLENAKETISFQDWRAAKVEVEVSAAVIEVAVTEVPSVEIDDEIDEPVNTAEFVAVNDEGDVVAEIETVSDDVTLSQDDILVGEEVEDIGDINFLDEAVSEPALEAVVSAEEPKPAPTGRKTPSFLKRS